MYFKLASKWLQKGFRSDINEDQKRSLFWVLFSNHCWLISEPQMGPQMRPKIAQTPALVPPGPPKDATGRPEAPGSTFGTFSNPFSTYLGGSSWLFWGCGCGCLGCFGLCFWSWWFCFWLFSCWLLLWLLAPLLLQPAKLKQFKVESPRSLNPWVATGGREASKL